MPELSISIVSYNTKDLLRNCLLSIKENTSDIDYEIIVVDNCSNDSSAEMVEKNFPEVKLIKNDQNLFFAPAHTQALKIAEGEYFCMLNPDMIILKDTLKVLLHKIKSDDRIGAIGCKLMSEDNKIQETIYKRSTLLNFLSHSRYLSRILKMLRIDKSYPPDRYEREGFVEVLQNSLMILPREFLVKKNMFDKNFKLYCTEDQISEELRAENLNIYYTPSVESIHFLGRSTNPRKNPLYIYRINRDDNYFFYKKYKGPVQAIIVYVMLTFDLLLIRIFEKIRKN